jgi:hypothetical protein
LLLQVQNACDYESALSADGSLDLHQRGSHTAMGEVELAVEDDKRLELLAELTAIKESWDQKLAKQSAKKRVAKRPRID